MTFPGLRTGVQRSEAIPSQSSYSQARSPEILGQSQAGTPWLSRVVTVVVEPKLVPLE